MKKQRFTKTRKTLISILVFSLISISTLFPLSARAAWEGDAVVAELMHQAWRTAYDLTQNTILSQLKIEASRVIKQRMEQLLAGTNNRSLVISDYEDFVFGSAKRQAVLFTRDFFRQINEGISEEARIPLRNAEQAILEDLNPSMPKVTIDEYVDGGTKNVFDHDKGGGVMSFLAAVENPYNNSFGAYIETKEKVDDFVFTSYESKKTEAIAGEGYKTVSEDGKIIPGSLVSKLTASAESMPIEIINNASSWPEVVSSVATSAIQATLKNGIRVVSRRIDDELRQIERTYQDGLKDISSEIYKQGKN